MYNYYSSSSALAEMQAVMIISIVVGIFFIIMAIWVMVSIISMSHSLKDIRDIMQKQYIISDTTRQPESKNIETAKQTTSNQQ